MSTPPLFARSDHSSTLSLPFSLCRTVDFITSVTLDKGIIQDMR